MLQQGPRRPGTFFIHPVVLVILSRRLIPI
ncbi:hypothetical protein ACHAWC_011937 [Mediolabrus comicus]